MTPDGHMAGPLTETPGAQDAEWYAAGPGGLDASWILPLPGDVLSGSLHM